LVEPPHSPFDGSVAGAGIVEARSDSSTTSNIRVGCLEPGTVTHVHVAVGQYVKTGDLLFELDNREALAELGIRRAELKAAQAHLAKLEQMPRSEELPPAEARVREAHANLVQQEDLVRRGQRLFTNQAIGEEEWIGRKQSAAIAREQLATAEANLALLRAGSWEPDRAIARANIEHYQAQVRRAEVTLERLRVLAPSCGQVLAVNVRLGEYVGAQPGQTLVILGDTSELHVRVDIDENDIPRFQPGLSACAKLRGDPNREFSLRFVRIEPYVIPKRSLTGDNIERVDTRVLQVIYAIEPVSAPLYVGMQLDVFMKRDSGDGS
jgi:multidrug resistance efflux pump